MPVEKGGEERIKEQPGGKGRVKEKKKSRKLMEGSNG